MNKIISVVIPLYEGDNYISTIIWQIEQCSKNIPDRKIELILSNDDPEHAVAEGIQSDKIAITIINTEENQGIHGARVKGFLESKGDYILFLDQDDKIEPEYFVSQLQALNSADAVVCNAMSAGRLKYNSDRPLSKAISRESMINEGNMILSPGQVLLRREAVPESWVGNIMRHNGADDWLLWLCMHSEGKKFALNSAVLFIRQMHYHNASFACSEMELSEQEVVEIIEKNQLLCVDERKKLRELPAKLRENRIHDNEKWKKMFLIQNDWFCLCNQGMSAAFFLRSRGVKTVAVYGYGYLGRALLEDLEHGHVKVSYVIDKNAGFLHLDKKCCTMEDRLEAVDAVVVTLVSDEEKIVQCIKRKLNAEVFLLEDIIADLSKKGLRNV